MNTPSPTAAAPSTVGSAQDYLPTDAASPETPEEAAQAFEKVLVRQFVQTMTKDMMTNPLSGEDGPGWMQSQRDQQQDILTDVLADHLVETNSLGIADMLLEDWGLDPEPGEATSPSNASEMPSHRPPHIAPQVE